MHSLITKDVSMELASHLRRKFENSERCDAVLLDEVGEGPIAFLCASPQEVLQIRLYLRFRSAAEGSQKLRESSQHHLLFLDECKVSPSVSSKL